VLLLLDGLDEWSDEQAARTTLQHILAFVATQTVPTIATARPRGLDKIGTIPPSWRIADLAPLSLDQCARTHAPLRFAAGELLLTHRSPAGLLTRAQGALRWNGESVARRLRPL
jgi:hypothetical protein